MGDGRSWKKPDGGLRGISATGTLEGRDFLVIHCLPPPFHCLTCRPDLTHFNFKGNSDLFGYI